MIGSIEKRQCFDETSTMTFVPGEFIVKLNTDTTFSTASLLALNEKHLVYALEKVFPFAEGTILDSIYLLHVPLESDILALVHDYTSCPDIVYAEPNGLVFPCYNPNDEHFGTQWSLDNTGQIILNNISGTPDADIDAPEAWDIERGSPDVVIAIVDSGIDYTHPDLAGKIWNNAGEIRGNGIDDDDNGYIDDVMGWDFYYHDNDPKDGHGHGTLCAGTAAAVTDNSIGIAGVGNCTIMPVQIADECWLSNWCLIGEGITYAADNSADIISMSCGTYYNSNLIRDAVTYASNKGVFLCAAAGNDNLRNKFYPAAYETVMAVAATNQHDERCTKADWDPHNWWPGELRGSNGGDWVDIAAPGTLIFSTMPTYPVTFNDIVNPYTGQNILRDYDWYGCTSAAAPLVAGVAALLVSCDPSVSPERVKALLCDNIDPYNSTVYIGTGRINAQKTLTAVLHSPTPPTITGPMSGQVGRLYDYMFTSTDPMGESISYVIDWGDGKIVKYGPFSSGEAAVISHIWSKRGSYVIKAQAQDSDGYRSDWNAFDVKILFINAIRHSPFWEWLLEQFRCLFPMLCHGAGK